MPEAAAFYVDGFNLYHAINDLGEPHLKWLDMWKLCASLIPRQSQELVKVTWCSALNRGDYASLTRHQKYKKALEATGVKSVMGHHIGEPAKCKVCPATWVHQREKETDVNVALSLFEDACDDVYVHAYLVTADSDQAATASFFKRRFPAKTFTTVAPPGRNFSTSILKHTPHKIMLTYDHIERNLFSAAVFYADGSVAALRPPEYAPPPGWVAPHLRP